MIGSKMPRFILLLLVGFIFGCSVEPGVGPSGGLTESASESRDQVAPPQETSDLAYQKDRIKAYVDVLSRRYGMTDLRNAELKDREIEVRLWSSIESDDEKCLVISRIENQWKAFIVSPKLNDGQIGKKGEKSPVISVSDLEPKTGWTQIEKYLEEMKIEAPLTFKLDSPSPPIPDEGILVLEVHNYGRYDLVSYRAFTESPHGKAVVSLCQRMEYEFGKSIGCVH